MENMNNTKDPKKNTLRIIIGIIIAVIFLALGAGEIKSGVEKLTSSVQNLKEDIRDIKEGD